MTTVTILYKSLPAYRLEFFDRLRAELAGHDIGLRLIHGDAVGQDRSKGDARTLPWAEHRPNRVVSLRGRPLVWQPALRAARESDLVIVEQASKLLVNYPLLLGSRLGLGPKLALWGHGANLQRHTASRLSEAMKRRYSRLPHWWFAYTDGARDRVERMGYPADRITVVQNAVDTAGLRAQVASVSASKLESFRREHSAQPGHTALFLGSLYPEKRIPFLVEAAEQAARHDERFTLLVGGDGPARGELLEAIEEIPQVRYLGRLDGEQRALALASGDVMLMPGLVGLGILDAFAGGMPVLTTRVDYHSPEIEYLEAGRNGLMLDGDMTAIDFGDAVVALLRDEAQLAAMSEQATKDAEVYTTAEMVRRFSAGVQAALKEA